MPDITNNPDVVNLVRSLNKLGAKVDFYRKNPRYGYLVVLLRPALSQIVNEFNKKWKTDIAKIDYDSEDGTVVYTLNFYDNYKLPENKIKEIEDFFLKHNILAVAGQTSDNTLTIVLHVMTYAKNIERKFVKRLYNSNAYFQYMKDTFSLVIHIWTGTIPEEVKVIKGGVK